MRSWRTGGRIPKGGWCLRSDRFLEKRRMGRLSGFRSGFTPSHSDDGNLPKTAVIGAHIDPASRGRPSARNVQVTCGGTWTRSGMGQFVEVCGVSHYSRQLLALSGFTGRFCAIAWKLEGRKWGRIRVQHCDVSLAASKANPARWLVKSQIVNGAIRDKTQTHGQPGTSSYR